MGFYGNITNVNKSTFQFDKIYPNRREMDISCASDGVFIGRYVLVDYDEESVASYVHSQLDEEYQNRPVVVGYQEKRRTGQNQYQILNDKFYSGIPRVSDDGSKIETDRLYVIGSSTEGISVQPGTLLLNVGYVITEQTVAGDPPSISWVVEFDREGSDPNKGFIPKVYLADESSSNFVLLTEIDNNSAIWNYHDKFVINHNIDAKFYGGEIGRGWDSTVWQKVYRDGTVSYVMIAELNSVVPTFDIQADSPVLPSEPWRQKPYYDADSSNVYYKLHWPSAWGFRIKASEDNTYSDGIYYPSDEQGEYYTKESYNANKDLAIYWFKDGFHKYLISKPEIAENKLKLTPTGKSGNEYWDSQTQTAKEAVDIYELSMMLPVIGETVSKLWDVVYGKGDYKDTLGNRLWNKAAFDLNEGGDLIVAQDPDEYEDADDIKIRNTNLQWNTRNGVRAYWQNSGEEESELTYNKTAYNTLAGTINSVHDLVGMIIIEDDNLLQNLDAAQVDPGNIYYDKTTGKYYRKGKKYNFNANDIVGVLGSNMFDPRIADAEKGSYYRLESYPFDNYDDIYSQNKESDEPIFEKIANNYYKMGQNDNVYEDEVYGTLIAEQIDLNELNPENFDPVNNDIWWLNEDPQRRGYSLGDYTREGDIRPKDDVKYYSLVATEVSNDEKPVFYEPKKYYLMTKTFVDKPNLTKEQQRDDWEDEVSRILNNNTDFDYLGLMSRSKKSDEINAIEAENQRDTTKLIGYRMLRGVAIDPDESTYIIYDANRIKGEITPYPEEDEENYPIIEQRDENDNIIGRVYTWNGFEAPLQGTKIIENGVDSETGIVKYAYKYDITGFVSESHASLGRKSLKQWKEYVEDPAHEVTAEDFNDLIPSFNFVRELTDPYYTLNDAEDITTKIIDFGESGATPYYYFISNNDPNTHEGQSWYSIITKADFDADQDSLWTNPWWILEPTPLPLYYDLNRGYYIGGTDCYLRETAPLIFDADKNDPNCPDYYQVRFTPETKTLFVPNLYYYLDNGEYKLADTLDSEKTYYRYIDKYVVDDPNDVYDLGARWNAEVDPRVDVENNNDDITIKGKTFEWEFQEIPYFAKDVNTLHGLILKINQMLLAGDKVTRDNSTVQGCINLINDILDKFDQLKPAEIVMVDKLGQIHSGDWDTKQKSSTQQGTAPAIPIGEPVAADDERWIKLSTTAGTSPDFKPHIKLEHMFRAGTDTTSASNLNTDNVASNNDSDKMQLYTPILDNMGHVVAKNIETVTLPYGFKTVSIGAESSAVANLAHAAADLVAENTQDTLTINPGNKWMKLAGTANNDSFSIGHLVQTIDTAPVAVSSDINGNGDTITIQDISNDEAGHITANKLHTYILPYGFKTITGNGGSLVADNTQDTAAFSGDTWIQTTASSNGVEFTHIGPAEVAARQDVVNLTPSFGQSFSIEDWRFDEKGHKAGLQTHTVTLPQPANALLVGYEQASSIGSMPAATDDIKTAFAKLSYVLDNNTTPIDTRLNNMGSKTLASSGISIMPNTGANVATVSRTFAEWAQLAEDMKYQLENWYQSVSFAAWPPGSIYMSIDDVNPAVRFGIGVWEKIAEGQFLISAGENFELGSTGGSPTITIDQMPEHGHKTLFNKSGGSFNWGFSYTNGASDWSGYVTESNSGIQHVGGGEDYYPPYIAVNVWKRIDGLEDSNNNEPEPTPSEPDNNGGGE